MSVGHSKDKRLYAHVITALIFIAGQALDPHLRHSARYAWPCLQCRSQLAGGTPPGPPGTHV